jgi:hypothetical protein
VEVEGGTSKLDGRPTAGSQTTAPTGPTAANSVPGGPTARSGGHTARAQEAHGLTESQDGPTATPSSQHAELDGPTEATDGPTMTEGGQTVSPGSPTARSCGTGASGGADGTSSPTVMEEDTNDDLLNYEPSPARNYIEINVVYLSSTDHSLLEEEEVPQLALGPQDVVFKMPMESEDNPKPL